MFNKTFFPEIHAVCETTRTNMVEPGRPQMAHAHCVLDTKATNTRSK
jgi:hypothetical protein